MLKRWPIGLFGVLALASTISCGPTQNPPPPKWTVENQSASTNPPPSPQTSAPKPAVEAKREGASTSSLEALRSGESTATTPSSALKDAYFAFDKYDLSSAARENLTANANWLKANPAARVQVEGHCDERGTQEYNMALGAKRAQATVDYLKTLGIAASRMSTISYGEEIPVCKEHTEDCWAKNRRARFVIVSGQPTS
ncbi:MAG TPA: peptidoglycan-associated lipoprotein Pal [Candidatus Acidoferrales bacterium]|nr:peptidoglycan-associated lipoprotein Pal [Candidatus Acidoferrales bacterium]